VSRSTRPVKELKGFRRITLSAGETRTVTFDVGPDALSYYGLDMKRVVEPGRYDIMLGGSSADVKTVVLEVAR
ncbi:MAG TPA: fibronectin type III-like domain-contianing protein, partial [Gemmatimonadaceae bacterium]|nr:fibronectin type III-like domain-contianing protein [Gemmatimonadaceae bacterium]